MYQSFLEKFQPQTGSFGYLALAIKAGIKDESYCFNPKRVPSAI